MIKVKFFIILTFFLLVPCQELFPWELALNKNGIKIYTRRSDFSSIKEFRVVMRLKSSMASFLAVLKDVASAHDWVPNNISARVIRQNWPREQYSYLVYKFPWPLENRDLIILRQLYLDRASGIITIRESGKPDLLPRVQGLVRIRKSKGSWKIIPQKNGYLKIIQQGVGGAGGDVPGWVVNLFIIETPYKAFLNLRKMVKRKKYREASFNFLKP